MDVFVPALALLALVKTIVDLVRRVQEGGSPQHKAAVLQLLAWMAGVLVVVLFAHSDWAESIPFGSMTLAHMNLWSQIIGGLTVGSAAMLAKDTLNAVDNTRTSAAVTPPDPLRPQ